MPDKLLRGHFTRTRLTRALLKVLFLKLMTKQPRSIPFGHGVTTASEAAVVPARTRCGAGMVVGILALVATTFMGSCGSSKVCKAAAQLRCASTHLMHLMLMPSVLPLRRVRCRRHAMHAQHAYALLTRTSATRIRTVPALPYELRFDVFRCAHRPL